MCHFAGCATFTLLVCIILDEQLPAGRLHPVWFILEFCSFVAVSQSNHGLSCDAVTQRDVRIVRAFVRAPRQLAALFHLGQCCALNGNIKRNFILAEG